MRSIDTTSGKTTGIVKSPINIGRLKVTHDNHVIVGSRLTKEAIFKYKLTGQLVKKSTEIFAIQDIDYCPKTNNVAISRCEEGLSLLNSGLTTMKTYNRKNMFCRSAIFDTHGNLIVADYTNKEIVVLDGESLNRIQILEIDSITSPVKLKLFDNIG